MAGIEGMLAEIIAEFPRFRLLRKSDSRLMSFIDGFLRSLTLGRQSRFLTEYHTVLGYTLFVAPTWESLDEVDKIVLLRHERVHLRQCRRFGLWGLTLLYLLPFFPVGLAYGRARLEWEAYSETIRALFELRGARVLSDSSLREHILRRFIGPDYAWMWPFRTTLDKWYDRLILELSERVSDIERDLESTDTNRSIGAQNPNVSKEPRATWAQS
jgi:hypothetical protein